jgi:hypothetical protein
MENIQALFRYMLYFITSFLEFVSGHFLCIQLWNTYDIQSIATQILTQNQGDNLQMFRTI